MATRPAPKKSPARSIRLPFRAPPRAWALAEWSLLPLRAFLGVTFLYASLQKLANPDFLHAASQISIQAQLRGAQHTSPIGFLIGPLRHIAAPLGIFLAVAEVAVGVGTLLGLWGRIAALGGAFLSLSLFLTVSFHSSPWFIGSDIVFLFAWTPLIISGSGTRLSMDAALAKHAAHGAQVPDPELVVMPFVQVQKMCGHFDLGKCKVQMNAPCQPHGCPILEGARPSLLTRGSTDHIDRRTLVMGVSRTLVVGGVTAVASALAGGIGWALHGRKKTAGSSTSGSALGRDSGVVANHLLVNHAATFNLANGDPGVVICVGTGEFVGYDAVCPHAGCTVGYLSNTKLLQCPCHSSQFDVASGNVLQGPANKALTKYKVVEGPNGHLYLS